MSKESVGGGAKIITISVSVDEKAFLEERQMSPSKLFHWALLQKGFKGHTSPKKIGGGKR